MTDTTDTRLGPMRVIYLTDDLDGDFDPPREGHAYVVLEASQETLCHVPLYGFVHLHSSVLTDEQRAERDCPHGEPLHYHRDGCPSCWQNGEDDR